MLYSGIILAILGCFTLFFSKDPFESVQIKAKLKDEKGYARFRGILYIVFALISLVFWGVSFYVSKDALFMPVMIICAIGVLFAYRYRKRYFD